ncbi:KEOPS complex subunit Pcc1 [Halalkaliarchaeum sp. AArc-GB]|uniref:KEOPS complex subunit Pcc1 n=1 Tax=unclassified Halalkaliarchaeum TaxID=2678344 RepID=UPI00217E727F|nr:MULTISPECIES: KEOPS complex subunit Pcc1 [unclassified Halalkaliarchaeum]MDR5673458.1 KEOPS complex subunit Pcc1 [Halalkaliarchaeum sp. AArc-GB]
MTDTHSATLSFIYPDEASASTVAAAVAVEQGELDDDRAGAAVALRDRTVEVTVDASDLVALRAGINSWTRLVDIAERTDEVAKRTGGADG